MKVQAGQGTQTRTQVQDVLVVDNDPRTTEALRQGLDQQVNIRVAAGVEQATLEMGRRPADLLVVNLQINDNAGVDLLRRLQNGYPQTAAIAVSRSDSAELCLDAWRAGAADMLVGSIDPAAVRACLQRVLSRRDRQFMLGRRNTRLRSVCRQLNKARHEIGQQVNLLCHDLVKAYQELAEQLCQTQVSGDFAAALGDEVEIETILRHTMEWILKKLGPVNAAVFLPDSEQNYALGAYLNFDTAADSVLVQTLAETVVREASGGTEVLVLENDQQIRDRFGEQSRLLQGKTWLASASCSRNETLAVLVAFRGQGESVDPSWIHTLGSISPVLAEKIARAVRVYQRGIITDEGGGNGGEGRDEPGQGPSENEPGGSPDNG